MREVILNSFICLTPMCSERNYMATIKVDIKELFEAGAHFGHRTSRRHPSMKQYVHSERDDVHILDLEKTQQLLEAALIEITEQVAKGKQVLFVGTKKQISPLILSAAQELEMPYVTNRWLGGMLTNAKTMVTRVKRLKQLEDDMASGTLAARYSKLEVQRFSEEIEKLNYNFEGVKFLNGDPGVVVVLDAVSDRLAITEANKMKIPVVAVVDSNADARGVDFPVPANDDALKSIEVILDYYKKAVAAGKIKAANKREKPAEKEAKAKAEKESK